MPTPTTIAVPPGVSRVLQRNRMLFGAFILALAPIVTLATGLFDRQPHPGPLLLAINDVPSEEVIPPPTEPAREYADVPTIFAKTSDELIAPAVSVADQSDTTEFRWFNGRRIRPAKTIAMVVTAYSPDERSCGENAQGITASGYSVWTNGMKLVAADTDVLPFGSIISVPGYDNEAVVPVLDRGGAIKGRRLDVLYPTHEQAQKWGRQTLEITVWEYVDGRPSDFVPRYHKNASVQARR